MKPILVIGAQGQMARAFKKIYPQAIYLDRQVMDLAYPDQVSKALEAYDPSVVINTAAYAQVDNAQSEEALAHIINAESPTAMAIYCLNRDIPLVHFSTDYVFDGSGEKPWTECDVPKPLNAYGRSKLAGDEAIARIGGKFLIFRTSWLYDYAGKNFFNTMIRLGQEREEIKVVNDQFGAPTFAPDLAVAVSEVLKQTLDAKDFPSGVYHLCHGGETNWHAFATEILRATPNVKVKCILPIAAKDYPAPAKRPRNSRLDCSLAQSMFGIRLPSWQEGLKACLDIRFSDERHRLPA